MKNKIVIFLIASLAFASFTTKTLGQSPTPETDNSVNEKVKEIREAVKEKVREKIEEIQQGNKGAYAGEITEINNSTLVLDTQSGQQQAEVDEETIVVDLNRREIDFEDLEVGNYVICMGYINENKVLQAKRVAVAKKVKTLNREVAAGRVNDISVEESIITVINEKKDIIYTVEATSQTVITKKTESGKVEKIKFNQISENDWVVTVGAPSENENKIITAKIIHVIPGKSKPLLTPTVQESEEE